jgi:hypothetical protein
MKKTLLLALLFILTLLNACKKDNPKKVQPKLKSITQTDGLSRTARTEFDYDAAGQLSESQQYENGDLVLYTRYNYTNSNMTAANIFQKMPGGADVELAEGKFSYEANRLSHLIIQYRDISPGNTSKIEVSVDYSTGNIPKVTTTSSGLPFELPTPTSNPRVGTIHLEDYTGNSSSQSFIFDLKSGYTFDDQINPLQNLPAIISIKLDQTSSQPGSAHYFHFFDTVNFFQPGNVLSTNSESGFFSKMTYTYNEKGWPIKSTLISSDNPFKTKISYEYW